MPERERAPASQAAVGAPAALRLIATGAGVGHLPIAPGTAGSLLGAALCLPFLSLPWPVYLGATILVIAVAIWAAGRVAAELRQPDPSRIVIDEIAGMWCAAIGLPPTLYEVAACFVLFRLFDVIKPAPMPRLERLPGGFGIVADDVAAGMLARAMWWLLKANFDFL